MRSPRLPPRMDDLPDWALEAAVAIGAVGLMFGVLYWIGTTYSTNGDITAQGGVMIVVAIVFFILLMAGIGVFLAYKITGADTQTVS